MSENDGRSRREFFSDSAARAIALAGGLSLARSAYAAGGDQLKVALIGSGNGGAGAAADCLNASENVKLVAIADAFEDRSGKILKINTFGRREVTNPYRREHVDLLDAIWNDRPYHEGWWGATNSFSAVLGREASYSGRIVK